MEGLRRHLERLRRATMDRVARRGRGPKLRDRIHFIDRTSGETADVRPRSTIASVATNNGFPVVRYIYRRASLTPIDGFLVASDDAQ